MASKQNKEFRAPTVAESLVVTFSLLLTIVVGFIILAYPITLMLLLSAVITALVATRLGWKWANIEDAIAKNLKKALPAIFIMYTVGIVIGSFIFSGSIPMIVYYGLKIISPKFFLPCSFIICSILSIATGTSWGSAGTAGLALLGIATGLGMPIPVTLGAIVAGCVIGDKMSPLSDCANMAAMSTGVNVYDMIKNMFWTTIPAFIIALAFYTIYGFIKCGDITSVSGGNLDIIMGQLNSIYNWSPLLIIPFVIMIGGVVLKFSAVPCMIAASISAVILGVFVHGFSLSDGINALSTGFNVAMINRAGFDASALSADVLKLLNRGGLTSMFNTVLIVFCAYAYAGVAQDAGFFDTLLGLFISRLKDRKSTVLASVLTGVFFTFVGGSSYIPIIMVGTLFKKPYLRQNIDLVNLSRTAEDTGTMIISIVPWSTSGTYYTGIFGVGPAVFAPYVLIPFLCPLIAIFYGFTGIGMKMLEPEEAKRQLAELESGVA